MLQYYYHVVLTGFGQLYLDAEQRLIALGQEAVPFLQEQMRSAAPMAKLITQVVLQRIAGDETFRDCLDFLDETEHKTAATAKGGPSPEWVAAKLFQTFGGKAAPLLGVHLIKLEQLWPHWKTMGVILYLGKATGTATADVLIKFMTATQSELYRAFALKSLVAVGDVAVLNRLEAELRSQEMVRNVLQQAAEQIREKLKAQE